MGFVFSFFFFLFKSTFVKPWTLGVLGNEVKVESFHGLREMD